VEAAPVPFLRDRGEKKIIVRDKRTRTKKAIYVKTYNRNEALDLTVYCYAALFCLQNVIDPTTFRDLGFLNQAILRTKQSLTSLAPDRKRKFRSRGVS
jgi:phage terminase large subunit GpA-like protein